MRHSIGDLILRLVKNVRPEFWRKEREKKKVDFSEGGGVSEGLSLPPTSQYISQPVLLHLSLTCEFVQGENVEPPCSQSLVLVSHTKGGSLQSGLWG